MRLSISKSKIRNILFYCLYVLLLILIYMRYVIKVEFSKEILLATLLCMELIADKDNLIAVVLCCMPLFSSLQYIYAVGFGCIIYFIKYSRYKIGKHSIWIFLFIMTFMELIHIIDFGTSMTGWIRYIIPFVFCGLVTCETNLQLNYKRIMYIFSSCTLFMCFVVMQNLLNTRGGNLLLVFRGQYRFGVGNEEIANMGANFNSNYLGLICLICIISMSQIAISEKKNILNYIIIIAALFFGCLTMSRTFFVLLVLSVILFSFVLARNAIRIVKLFALAFSVVILGLCLLNMYAPVIIENIFARFSELEGNIGGSRSSLFSAYQNLIFSNPRIMTIGIGVQNLYNKTATLGMDNVSHNGYQEALLAWGIPGCVGFVGFVFSITQRFNVHRRLINFIPFIVVAIALSVSQAPSSGRQILLLTFASISLSYDFNSLPVKEHKEKAMQNKIICKVGDVNIT